jgi:hypothetical protein
MIDGASCVADQASRDGSYWDTASSTGTSIEIAHASAVDRP